MYSVYKKMRAHTAHAIASWKHTCSDKSAIGERDAEVAAGRSLMPPDINSKLGGGREREKFISSYAHTYTCIHACIHSCPHTCIHACLHACMYACMHVCMHAGMHVCGHECMHACMHVYVCAYEDINVSLSLSPPDFELMSGGIRLRPAATSASRSPIALLSLQVCFHLAIAFSVCARIFLYTEYIFPPLLLLCMTCIHIHVHTCTHAGGS